VEARTEALGRAHETLRRKEQLAAIGGSAAGTVHEIGSPLSTLNMALDYLDGLGLAEPAARLESLRYATPPQLRRAMLDARALLEDTRAIVRGSPEGAHRRIVLKCAGEPKPSDKGVARYPALFAKSCG
jgi:C4-dicarboxylate-specific signal transduction histidine kinase